MDNRIKRLIASVETSGDTKGDYAQLTPIVLRDLQQLGMFKDITMDEVKKDPALYDKVVEAYWRRMEDFGVPSSDLEKTIWLRAPGLYRKYGGDVRTIKDPYLRNVMMNRVKNLTESLKGTKQSPYKEELAK